MLEYKYQCNPFYNELGPVLFTCSPWYFQYAIFKPLTKLLNIETIWIIWHIFCSPWNIWSCGGLSNISEFGENLIFYTPYLRAPHKITKPRNHLTIWIIWLNGPYFTILLLFCCSPKHIWSCGFSKIIFLSRHT